MLANGIPQLSSLATDQLVSLLALRGEGGGLVFFFVVFPLQRYF